MGDPTSEASPQSNWERLPPEIQAEIFLMCRPLNKDLPPSKKHAPYLLTYVCRAWHRMVVESPKMWSMVALVTKPDGTDTIAPSQLHTGTRHLKMCAVRAGIRLLELHVRAEFLKYPAFSNRIQKIRKQISRMYIRYPFRVAEPLPSYLPPSSLRMAMPNLQVLSVQSFFNICNSDRLCLNRIMTTAQTLTHCIFNDGSPRVEYRQPISRNMFNLEALTIGVVIPVFSCFSILKNIPTLQRLSLLVEMPLDEPPSHQEGNLSSTSAMRGSEPFVHPRLQYLALLHYRSHLSAFFERVTLPQLQFLTLHSHGESRGDAHVQAVWKHGSVANFFQRSGCKIKYFDIICQPISPSQLIQLFTLPNIANSLEYFGIRSGINGATLNDSVLEQLTIPPSTIREGAGSASLHNHQVKCTEEQPIVLCPNIQRLLLLARGYTPSKLIAMLNSRLPPITNSAVMSPYKPLRHVEMRPDNNIDTDFESLREKGLVLTLVMPPGSSPPSPNVEQQRRWGCYLSEGGNDEVYDIEARAWRASDMTLHSSLD